MKVLFIRSVGLVTTSLVILMGLMNRACEFESKETLFVEVSEPVAEAVSAELNFSDSVIYIDEATLFEYSVSFLKQEFYAVEFYLNGYLIKTIEDSNGSVLVDPIPGKHSFEMVVYSSTESGSIADRVGAEVFTYSQSWTIYSENDAAGEIQIINIEKKEGSLLIEWDRYPGYFFQSYQLIKYSEEGDIILFETNDVDQTAFPDSYFVGGSADYYVRFHKTNGKVYTSDTISYALYPDTIGLNVDWQQQNLTINWSRCKFDSNFSQYILSLSLNDGPYVAMFSTKEIEDTTLTIPVGENLNLGIELSYYSNMPDNTPGNGILNMYSENIFTGPFYLPRSLPAFDVIVQSRDALNRIYTPEYIYNVTGDVISYWTYNEDYGLFDVSDNNNQLISGLSFYRSGVPDPFYFIEEISGIPSTVFDNEERRARISENYHILVESGSSTYLYRKYAGGVELQHFENDSLYWGELSPQGHYVIAADKSQNSIDVYYQYPDKIGGVWYYYFNWIRSLNGSAGNYVFTADTEFALIWNDYIEIRSCESMLPENGNGDGFLLSAPTPATRIVEADPISNTLLACSSDSLYVYDLTDLRLLGSIPNSTVYQRVIKRGPQQVAYLNSCVFFMEDGATEATMQPLPIEKWR